MKTKEQRQQELRHLLKDKPEIDLGMHKVIGLNEAKRKIKKLCPYRSMHVIKDTKYRENCDSNMHGWANPKKRKRFKDQLKYWREYQQMVDLNYT